MKPVNILAPLKGIPGVKAEVVEVDVDANRIGTQVAESVAEQIKDNFHHNLAPDGSPMPPLAASTLADKRRPGHGPRGIATGRMVASIRGEKLRREGQFAVGAEERDPGQLERALGGKLFAVTVEQPKIQAGLEKTVASMVKKK